MKPFRVMLLGLTGVAGYTLYARVTENRANDPTDPADVAARSVSATAADGSLDPMAFGDEMTFGPDSSAPAGDAELLAMIDTIESEPGFAPETSDLGQLLSDAAGGPDAGLSPGPGSDYLVQSDVPVDRQGDTFGLTAPLVEPEPNNPKNL